MQGRYLRRLRLDAGLTQLQVAKALGFEEPTTIGHWENQRQFVGLIYQDRLAEVLGVNAAEFVLRLAVYHSPALRALAWRAPGRQSPRQQAPAQGCAACS